MNLASRDGKEDMNLGFFGDRAMADNEVEEGEACAYFDNKYSEDDIDPDVALAYIGERVQNVLGHLQKEFEGGVSAENLGSKFGGYGSFLPTYQRSPPKVHDYAAPKPTNDNQGGGRNSAVPSSAHRSVRFGSATSGTASLPLLKTPSDNDLVKHDVCTTSTNSADELAPNHDCARNKSARLPEQKVYKVRIKVGSDNLPAQKNSAIYNGLGLDVSSSSSPEDILSESEGGCLQESPTSILRVMTSFPVDGGLVLSPLPGDLLQLKAFDGKILPGHQRERKVVGEKNVKSQLRYDISEGSANQNNQGALDAVSKEVDVETLTCEELVSNTLKLPLLSNTSTDETRKGMVKDPYTTKESRKAVVRNKAPTNVAKEEMLEGCKGQEAEFLDPPKRKGIHRVTSHQHDSMAVHPEKEITALKGKSKSKAGQDLGALAAKAPKEVSRVSSDSVSKNNNNAYMTQDFKLGKNLGNSGDHYREIFGDINFEDENEENQVDSPEFPPADRRKSSQMAVKRVHATNNAPKERSHSKRSDKSSISESHFKADLGSAPEQANLGSLDGHASVLVEDNWVQCDKCRKWRLLPNGQNPDSLPEKWLCVMQDWLPGMNKCSISQEETTKAFYELYQVPVPQRQYHVHSNTGGGMTSNNIHPQSQNLQHTSFSEPSGGKKKHGLEVSDSRNEEGSSRFSSSMKRNMKKSSVKSRSLNDVNFPLAGEPGIQQGSKSGDLTLEKSQQKQKEKRKSINRFSDGGDTKKSKMEDKGESGQYNSTPSKRVKTTEDVKFDGEGRTAINGASGKISTSSSSGLPSAAGKNMPKYNGRSLTGDKYDIEDGQVLGRKSKENLQVPMNNKSPHMENHCSEDALDKKRKRKGCQLQDGTIHLEDLSANNVCRKEKKSKVSKHERRESGKSKGSGETERKGNRSKNQGIKQDMKSTLPEQSLDGLDSEKRESRPVQPSAATTSSSSKISVSQKSKTSLGEVKGSPVESVSSSPMRVSKSRRLTSTRDRVLDESQGNGYSEINSRTQFLDGDEEGGSSRSGNAEREKIPTLACNASVHSSVPDCQEADLYQKSVSGAELCSPDVVNQHSPNGFLDKSHGHQDSNKQQAANHVQNAEIRNDKDCHANGFVMRHPPEVRPKDKFQSIKSKFDVHKNEIIQPHADLGDRTPSQEMKPKDSNYKQGEMAGNRQHASENTYLGKESGKVSQESSKGGVLLNHEGYDGSSAGEDAICVQSPPGKALLQNSEGKRSTKRSSAEKTDQEETASGRAKLLPLPHGVDHNETVARCTQPVLGNQKETGADNMASGILKGEVVPKLPKKSETQHISLRHHTPNRQKARDTDVSSTLKRESSSHAASSALREAKNLKHMADKLKSSQVPSGSINESTGIYFEAALKFLLCASLLESSNSESARNGEVAQAVQMYSSTAKLCEFCAREYEKSKDMASAALAYKCMEVAYMRVVYSSQISVNRDRQELLTALKMTPGESPPSSAFDVDNIDNLASVDKTKISKGASSVQVSANPVISGRNRLSIVGLLNFMQSVNNAMEASRKSHASVREAELKEGISSIKRALDFSFQDVEEFLHLDDVVIVLHNESELDSNSGTVCKALRSETLQAFAFVVERMIMPRSGN